MIQVFVRGLNGASEVRTFAEEKLTAALERFQENVLDATLRIEDETGPSKHGMDKVCSIDVKLRTGEFHIRETGTDTYATIDVALDRLRTKLGKEVSKTKRGIAEG
jgi:ribosomal subunit interface protein